MVLASLRASISRFLSRHRFIWVASDWTLVSASLRNFSWSSMVKLEEAMRDKINQLRCKMTRKGSFVQVVRGQMDRVASELVRGSAGETYFAPIILSERLSAVF